MTQTINKPSPSQIIGGIFSSRETADKAVKALEALNISPENIQEVVQLDGKQVEDTYTGILTGRGFSESQARYYDECINEGKILVAVHDVTDPAPVIDIFDRYEADYNPNGSRNLRQDVLGTPPGTDY